jgi:hypothetical protein
MALSAYAQDYLLSQGVIVDVVLADGVTHQVVSVEERDEMQRQKLLWTPPADGKALTETDVYGVDLPD